MNTAEKIFPAHEQIFIGPQAGPQTEFLSTKADIAIYGGAAGGGKSYAILLEPLRHIRNPKFGGVIFRRNSTQVRNEGGLWQESLAMYSQLNGHPREAFLEWQFPTGARMKFAHLEHERSVYDWHGSQIPFIGFDELTHFSERQFFYMLSRNRSTSGISGYVRATCNPDSDSWVRKLISWWIGSDGYPIPERAGVLRWFIRRDDRIIWGDSKDSFGSDETPKSVTFIPSSIYDNKILMDKDPSYISNLKALPRVERLRLLGGNWDVRISAGTMFQREWFPVVNAIPSGFIQAMRYWDRASSPIHEGNKDPDFTRGLKLLKYPNNSYVVADVRSIRDRPAKVEDLIKNVASHDGPSVRIMSQKDPGSAGETEALYFVRMLQGFDVRTETIHKDKITRATPVSAQCEVGNISVLRAPWNDEFFAELENFPDGSHDDQVDTLSGAFNALSSGGSILDGCR